MDQVRELTAKELRQHEKELKQLKNNKIKELQDVVRLVYVSILTLIAILLYS